MLPILLIQEPRNNKDGMGYHLNAKYPLHMPGVFCPYICTVRASAAF